MQEPENDKQPPIVILSGAKDLVRKVSLEILRHCVSQNDMAGEPFGWQKFGRN